MDITKKGQVVRAVSVDRQSWRDVIELFSEAIVQDVDELLVRDSSLQNIGESDVVRYRVRSFHREDFKAVKASLSLKEMKEIAPSFFCQEKPALQYLNLHMKRLGKNRTGIVLSNDGQLVIKQIPSSHFTSLTTQLIPCGLLEIFKKPTCLSLKLLGIFQLEDFSSTSLISKQHTTSHYILMENILRDWDFEHAELTAIYDLKGSDLGRHAEENSSDETSEEEVPDEKLVKQSRNKKSRKNKSVLYVTHHTSPIEVVFGKDNNLTNRPADREALTSLDEPTKLRIMQAIAEETSLFEKANTMDYSLLVLIGRLKETNVEAKSLKGFHNVVTHEGNRVISFGLIDFLSAYDMKRVIENKWKSFVCFGLAKVSCVSPPQFRQRLITYAQEELFKTQSADVTKHA